MSTIKEDIQSLEPGPLVELWELDAVNIGGEVVRFQSDSETPIIWQGQTYAAWPIKGEGFARTSAQQPAPKLMVGNLNGSITELCLLFEDLVGATLTRRRTFAKYLDGQPTADPTQEYDPELWFIERKASETAEYVEFELSTAMDFNGQRLPARQIIADHCPAQWVYRGVNCGYTGPPVADANDNPTTDMALDRCGKRLSSCKLRQWPDGVLNFGGFPASGLVRT